MSSTIFNITFLYFSMVCLESMSFDISHTHVHVLHPVNVESDATAKEDLYMVNEYGRQSNTKALTEVLHSLDLRFSVHNISLANYKEVLQSIDRHQSVVFNLCDGNEFDGYPGSSVIQEMDRLQLKYTGANYDFYRISQHKPLMKKQLMKDGIPTMPFIEINENTSSKDIDTHWRSYPVIVKPITSYASMDITRQSVCFNAEETLAQSARIRPRALNGIFAEGFLAGREFTVLLMGDSTYGIKVFPPMERAFNTKLSMYERFLNFDLYWDGYGVNNETKDIAGPLCEYKHVSESENQILTKVAKDAYMSIGGNGYARVDIRTSSYDRFDPTVLEVNAQCGLSFNITEGASSMSHIFRQSNISVDQFTLALIDYAQNRQY